MLGMAINRWEWLEGLKAESAVTAAVKHVAKMIFEELSNWPPEVSTPEGHTPSRYAAVLGPLALRPSVVCFEEAIRRARWELERNYDAIDFYERNHHLAKACPSENDRLASEFIQHYILESYFVLMERTNYRVKRKDALFGVDAFERLVQAAWGRDSN
jgi:hypothetical protein